MTNMTPTEAEEGGGRVRVHSNWQRMPTDILGRGHAGESNSFLILTRTLTVQDTEFETTYHFNRFDDREHFTLVGPLARIDWRGLQGFRFRSRMDKVKLRAEAVVWHAKGMEAALGYDDDYSDSWQDPGLLSWWTGADPAGPPRRVRVWVTVKHVNLSLYVCEDGVMEMNEMLILPGRPRRNSAVVAGAKPWVEGVSSRSAVIRSML